MPILTANATTQAKTRTMTGAQLTGIIPALAFFLMVVSSAGAQVTLLYNFGTHAGDPAHANYPGFLFRAVMGTSTALPTMEVRTMQVLFSRSLQRDRSAYCTVSME
jgi:hypothetical protein